MSWDLVLMAGYQFMALLVAAAMIWNILESRNWRPQVFAALVLVPFLLRGLGVK